MALGFRDGDTIYDASNNALGVWKNGQITKNPAPGVNLFNPTGFQQKPSLTGSATQRAVGSLFPTGGFNQGLINNSGYGTGTMAGVVNFPEKPPNFGQLSSAQQGNVVATGAYGDALKSVTNAKPGGPISAPPAGISTGPAITASPSAAATADTYNQQRLALARERQSALMNAIQNMQSTQNPYDQKGLDNAFVRSDDNVSRAYANAERSALEQMSARGMMGSGQDSAIQSAIAAERAGAYSSGRNQAQARWTEQGNSWQQNQNSAILNALGGGNLDSTLADLANSEYNRSRDALNDQRLSDSERNQMLALIAKLGVENADKIIKMFGGG